MKQLTSVGAEQRSTIRHHGPCATTVESTDLCVALAYSLTLTPLGGESGAVGKVEHALSMKPKTFRDAGHTLWQQHSWGQLAVEKSSSRLLPQPRPSRNA